MNVVINAGLSFLFVPRYGAIGAALAVATTQVVGTLVVVAIYLRETGAHPIELVRFSGADRAAFLQQLRDVTWLRSQER